MLGTPYNSPPPGTDGFHLAIPVISGHHALTWPSKCTQQSTSLHTPWRMFFFCLPGCHMLLALLLAHCCSYSDPWLIPSASPASSSSPHLVPLSPAFPSPTIPGTQFQFLGVSLLPFSLIPQIGSTRKSFEVHSQNISIILFLTISLLVLGPNLIRFPSRSYRISSEHPDSL